ncbi:porin [Pantoea sp. Mhis]|uniref:porin n=1 Tax=Pantoea sp. Mhis TaxID=2576759 RepID=UPI001356F649|nr:porin [Pantoea sp. Mhis]MXP56108.1 porin OmpC [Pantoea sp. Mhis]
MKPCIFSKMIPIPALLIASLTNAVEVYNKGDNKLDINGKVNGIYHISAKQKETITDDHSNLSFGVRGESRINDQLTGYGQWEYKALLNTSENESTKDSHMDLGFAGIKFNNGSSLDYGRNYGIAYDIAAWTDVLPGFGGDTYGADNFMFHRGSRMTTYRSNNFFGLLNGLNFAFQHQGQNTNYSEISSAGRDVLSENGNGWGFSTTYKLDSGIEIGAAMFHSKRTNNQNGDNPRTIEIVGHDSSAEAYTGGLRYNANNIYLAAMYTRSYNATRFGNPNIDNTGIYGYAATANNIELVAQYKSDFGLCPSLGFVSSKGYIQGYGIRNMKKYISVGATYNFSKNLSTHIAYQINLLNSNSFTDAMGVATDNVISVGLVYRF